MHIVADTGDEAMLKYLHQLGANANLQDREEKTPLHIATERGHYRVVDLLIEKFKVPVLNRTRDGNTLMHIASKSGPPEMALIFLRKGVPLHMPNKKGAKAIHMAAMAGHADVVKSIIQKGEDVDCKTNDGHTALHLAVESGQADIVEALLGYGASVTVNTEHSGETPLHIAARVPTGRLCAELLLKSGAEVNATQLALETPLHLAARHGHLDTVTTLLDEGANVEVQNELGESPLHVAVAKGHQNVCEHLLQIVQDKKGRLAVERLVNQPNKRGESALHYAAILASLGEKPKTEVTVENNVKDKRKGKLGKRQSESAPLADLVEPSNLTATTTTALTSAEQRKMIIRALIKAGGDVALGTLNEAETPIHYCCRSGDVHVLKEIISQLAPIDAQIVCNKQAKARTI